MNLRIVPQCMHGVSMQEDCADCDAEIERHWPENAPGVTDARPWHIGPTPSPWNGKQAPCGGCKTLSRQLEAALRRVNQLRSFLNVANHHLKTMGRKR